MHSPDLKVYIENDFVFMEYEYSKALQYNLYLEETKTSNIKILYSSYYAPPALNNNNNKNLVCVWGGGGGGEQYCLNI